MATAQQRLTKAEEAYDLLVTGRMARVYVDQNGERVEYVAASAPRLLQHIASLKAEISGNSAGPLSVWL